MSDQSSIHDTSHFPIVYFYGSSVRPGYGDAWCAEMDALSAGDDPFVLIYVAGGPEEELEDRAKRGAWLKANKSLVEGKLLALIHVEPDDAKRAVLEKMLPKLVQAFGTPQAARGSQVDAEDLARLALAGGKIGE